MQSGFLVLQDGSRLPARDGLTMGRHAQCDIVIEDTKASRRHARLVVQGSVVEIEDLESSNGTYLNGTQIRRRLLRDGDEVRIGLTSIVYAEGAVEEAAAPVPSSPAAPPMASSSSEDDDLLELEFEDPPTSSPVSAPDPHEPGGGLEGDPLTNPPPAAAPAPAPAPAPPPSSPPPRDDVEVLEFVDEVVEVKKAPPRPEPRSAASSAASSSRPVASRAHGVLQYSKTASKGGLLGDDLAQMAGWKRWGLIALAIAAAVGVGYGVMQLVGST